MRVNRLAKPGCCSVGYGGPYRIAGFSSEPTCEDPWHILWLPKGSAPTKEDYVICLVACPPDEDWDEYGLGSQHPRPPLIEAICQTIENYMKDKQSKSDENDSD